MEEEGGYKMKELLTSSAKDEKRGLVGEAKKGERGRDK